MDIDTSIKRLFIVSVEYSMIWNIDIEFHNDFNINLWYYLSSGMEWWLITDTPGHRDADTSKNNILSLTITF